MKDHKSWTVGRFVTPPSETHAVQFYDTEEFLCETVAEFLAEGARAGEPLVSFATPAHQEVIVAALRAKGVDCASLVSVDAREMLSAFMAGGMPDEQLFRNSAGSVIAAAAGPQKIPVRAYGEMADLLFCSGNVEASLRLEEFWNDLAGAHPFSILCAHSLENFYDDSDTRLLHEVCRRHGRANPAG